MKTLKKFGHAVDLMIVFRKNEKWTINIGAGFIKEDIKSVFPLSDGSACTIDFGDNRMQLFHLDKLNLRELKELSEWVSESETLCPSGDPCHDNFEID